MEDKDNNIKKPSKSGIGRNAANDVHEHNMGVQIINLMASCLTDIEREHLMTNARDIHLLFMNTISGQQTDDDHGEQPDDDHGEQPVDDHGQQPDDNHGEQPVDNHGDDSNTTQG